MCKIAASMHAAWSWTWLEGMYKKRAGRLLPGAVGGYLNN